MTELPEPFLDATYGIAAGAETVERHVSPCSDRFLRNLVV
jgi:hypothetical protein